MMLQCLLVLLPLALALPESQGQTAAVQQLRIVGAELYYGRIPVQYWEHRIMMVKSMGFNAITFYIVWNYHEVEKGVFDYQNENKNLTLFLELAKKYQLYVLIRPGPFVCAEWDLGGLPPRLLNVEGMHFRQNNPLFMEQVKMYFSSLAPVIEPFLKTNHGPILYLQIENQYGYWGDDQNYIQALRRLWWDLDISIDHYFADAANQLNKTFWQGANVAVNDGATLGHYEEAKKLGNTGRIFGGEIYSGWFTHWGENLMGMSVEEFTNQFTFLFENSISFSMYVAHGGTSFGLTAGANILFEEDGKGDYWQGLTSYDYDAPINEQGAPTEKFEVFRSMAKRFVDWDIPEPPSPIPVIWIPPFYPVKVASLLANLPEPSVVDSERTFPFESDELRMYNQGIAVYETILQRGFYRFRMDIHDFALVMVGRELIATFDRSEAPVQTFNVTCARKCKMLIIVQALGHLSFGYQMEQDLKGIVGIEDKKQRTFRWNIYGINITESILSWDKIDKKKSPALFKATFELEEVGDTFFNLKNYRKGYVWVNGRNLGRFWDKGPQFKLYCPGVWLRQGRNQLFILDLLNDEPAEVTGDEYQWD